MSVSAKPCAFHAACVPRVAAELRRAGERGDAGRDLEEDEDDEEDVCDHEIVMPFDDDVRFSTSQYREKLYAEIENRSREAKRRLMAMRPDDRAGA